LRPRPGRLFEEIKINLARRAIAIAAIRQFQAPGADRAGRSLDRNVPDADAKSTTGEAMWW